MKILNENIASQTRHSNLVKSVVGIEVYGALAGLTGGIPFLIDPSGKLENSDLTVLANTPISNFFPVGLWLSGIFGVGGLLVAYLLWTRRTYGRSLAYMLGAVTVFWVGIENVVFGPSIVLAGAQMIFCTPQIFSAILIFRSRRLF